MNRIDLSSPFPTDRVRVEIRPEENPIEFHVGEKVLGTVLEQIDDRHAIVQLKGRPQWVESHLPLSKNMEGFFQVESTSPQVILKIIPEERGEGQQIGTWMKQHLSDHFPLEDLSKKLLGLCELEAEGIFPSVSDTAGRLL